jgi:3-oxoacyl-[acyl-carrier-protein] synthase III
MRASILGLGQWLPATIRGNDAWPPQFGSQGAQGQHRELVEVPVGTQDECDRIVARYLAEEGPDPFMGTTYRRVADDAMSACEAESLAAMAALEDAGVSSSDIDTVISWSIVPDRVSLPSAPSVAHRIGATRAFGVGIDAACASAIAGLQLGASLIESGRATKVLLTQSHLVTRVFPLAHPASPNVGDAATAVVLGDAEGPRVDMTWSLSEGQYYRAVTFRRPEDDPPWWQAGPDFYMGSLDRAAARHLVQNTVRFGAQTVGELARAAHVSPERIDVLVSVQPRKWIPSAIAEVLGLPVERASQTFDQFAHLGGCGVVANLIAARSRGMLTPGAIVALFAQGAGFSRAAALIRW